LPEPVNFEAVNFELAVLQVLPKITTTLEWARHWADPERKLRSRCGTYLFYVPALVITIIGTFVVPLWWR